MLGHSLFVDEGAFWHPWAASLFQVKELHQDVTGGKKGRVPSNPEGSRRCVATRGSHGHPLGLELATQCPI